MTTDWSSSLSSISGRVSFESFLLRISGSGFSSRPELGVLNMSSSCDCRSCEYPFGNGGTGGGNASNTLCDV